MKNAQFVYLVMLTLYVTFSSAIAVGQVSENTAATADSTVSAIRISKVTLASDIPFGKKWGSLKAGYFCGPYRNLYWRRGDVKIEFPELEERLKPILENAVNLNFEKSHLSTNELIVLGTITDGEAKLCSILASLGNPNSIKGTVRFNVRWEMFEVGERNPAYAIETIGFNSETRFIDLGAQEMFFKALSKSVESLLNTY